MKRPNNNPKLISHWGIIRPHLCEMISLFFLLLELSMRNWAKERKKRRLFFSLSLAVIFRRRAGVTNSSRFFFVSMSRLLFLLRCGFKNLNALFFLPSQANRERKETFLFCFYAAIWKKKANEGEMKRSIRLFRVKQ